MELWRNTSELLQEVLRDAATDPTDVAAVGITNQRETVVVWELATGRPVGNAIVWQDTRTQDLCQRIIDAGHATAIQERTGLVVATYFSAPKLAWLLGEDSGLRARGVKGEIVCGTIDSWLVWWLTGGPAGGRHVTDWTNASRTMLMNLRTLEWDEEMLDLFSLPREMLPRIVPPSDGERFGRLDQRLGLGEVPIGSAVGDQQAALLGQACIRAGEAKNTYGTGSFLLLNTGSSPSASTNGLLATAAFGTAATGPTYALEGSIAITGAAVQWLRDNLGLISNAAETESLAREVDDSGGVYFVPAFSGLFAPHWDMTARGVLVGLTRHTDRRHLVRATLEAICYQTRDVVEAMEADSGVPLDVLQVDGGASRNDLLMQLQADILGRPVVRPEMLETTALGAAYAAGLAVGLWSMEEIGERRGGEVRFEPRWSEERREEGYRAWQRAVERTRGWVQG